MEEEKPKRIVYKIEFEVSENVEYFGPKDAKGTVEACKEALRMLYNAKGKKAPYWKQPFAYSEESAQHYTDYYSIGTKNWGKQKNKELGTEWWDFEPIVSDVYIGNTKLEVQDKIMARIVSTGSGASNHYHHNGVSLENKVFGKGKVAMGRFRIKCDAIGVRERTLKRAERDEKMAKANEKFLEQLRGLTEEDEIREFLLSKCTTDGFDLTCPLQCNAAGRNVPFEALHNSSGVNVFDQVSPILMFLYRVGTIEEVLLSNGEMFASPGYALTFVESICFGDCVVVMEFNKHGDGIWATKFDPSGKFNPGEFTKALNMSVCEVQHAVDEFFEYESIGHWKEAVDALCSNKTHRFGIVMTLVSKVLCGKMKLSRGLITEMLLRVVDAGAFTADEAIDFKIRLPAFVQLPVSEQQENWPKFEEFLEQLSLDVPCPEGLVLPSGSPKRPIDAEPEGAAGDAKIPKFEEETARTSSLAPGFKA